MEYGPRYNLKAQDCPCLQQTEMTTTFQHLTRAQNRLTVRHFELGFNTVVY